MAERAAARSEQIAATIAATVVDAHAPLARDRVAGHLNPPYIQAPQAEAPAGTGHVAQGTTSNAVLDTKSRTPATTDGDEHTQASPPANASALSADAGMHTDSSAEASCAQPAISATAEPDVLREVPERRLPAAQLHAAEAASVATDRGDDDGDGAKEGGPRERRGGACAARPQPPRRNTWDHRPPWHQQQAHHSCPSQCGCLGDSMNVSGLLFWGRRMCTSRACALISASHAWARVTLHRAECKMLCKPCDVCRSSALNVPGCSASKGCAHTSQEQSHTQTMCFCKPGQ